ncbi:MAG: ubiquinone biosynthesis protein Coq4 [Halioglobus sp.]|jgi:ubiquinone biosynthesis protein Coq4
MSIQLKLQETTGRMDASTIANAVTSVKRGEKSGQLQLAAVMAWVAYSCPDATTAVYDNITSAWLGSGPTPEIPLGLPEAPLPASFWQAFWAVVEGPPEGYDALTITVAVAALADALHPDFVPIAENSARQHKGAAISLSNPVPGHTDIAALEHCPDGSLGLSLYTMIIDNGYDPEVLDREAIKLSSMPHSLHYLNARILQMHDVWHLVAGYETTSSNEIAISSFQLAQFGHNYSAMFLTVGMTMSVTKEPRGFAIILQIISEAWQHGRQTPEMMDIRWENEWNKSLEAIRSEQGITTYASVFPTNLLELIESPSLWKKAYVTYLLTLYHWRLRRVSKLKRSEV